jgi:hypothetical protein
MSEKRKVEAQNAKSRNKPREAIRLDMKRNFWLKMVSK